LVLPQGKIFFADLKRVIELVGENISDAEIEEMIKEVSPPTQEPDPMLARLRRHWGGMRYAAMATMHVTQRPLRLFLNQSESPSARLP
jgi:hypothetical protein